MMVVLFVSYSEEGIAKNAEMLNWLQFATHLDAILSARFESNINQEDTSTPASRNILLFLYACEFIKYHE